MDVEALLARALALADGGEWGAMADLLRGALAEHDGEPAVHCWLGVAERELGLDGVAYERFKRALALDPTDPHVLATAGNAVAAFDDPDAEAALRAAALLAPDLPLARLLYGGYLAREGFSAEALGELEAARALDEGDPRIAYELGVARALAGESAAAADALADAVALDASDAWARVVFGLALLEDGRPEEAAGELEEGARLAPEDVEAQVLAALAAGSLGSDATAWELLERARLRAEEADVALLADVEDRLDEGPEAARELLVEDLAPAAFHRRLMTRP